jgi:hypothetical protein
MQVSIVHVQLAANGDRGGRFHNYIIPQAFTSFGYVVQGAIN